MPAAHQRACCLRAAAPATGSSSRRPPTPSIRRPPTPSIRRPVGGQPTAVSPAALLTCHATYGAWAAGPLVPPRASDRKWARSRMYSSGSWGSEQSTSSAEPGLRYCCVDHTMAPIRSAGPCGTSVTSSSAPSPPRPSSSATRTAPDAHCKSCLQERWACAPRAAGAECTDTRKLRRGVKGRWPSNSTNDRLPPPPWTTGTSSSAQPPGICGAPRASKRSCAPPPSIGGPSGARMRPCAMVVVVVGGSRQQAAPPLCCSNITPRAN
jgi:hypothetical protein